MENNWVKINVGASECGCANMHKGQRQRKRSSKMATKVCGRVGEEQGNEKVDPNTVPPSPNKLPYATDNKRFVFIYAYKSLHFRKYIFCVASLVKLSCIAKIWRKYLPPY